MPDLQILQMTDLLIIVVVLLVAILAMGLVFSRLYHRASKETSFVRTGLGGQKVVMNGGALVFPVLHETIPVNMNTLRLEVKRANQQALITKDRMRVDVLAEFYVRVQPTVESIANAAQTLGQRTMFPEALKELVEGKFVDALRAVAAEMAMEELHEQRVQFVQKVQAAVSEDLLKNGLELESVSLTGLDQTDRDFFNPNNAFDAAGLTRLTDEIEERRRRRNEIEQDTEVAIETKNLQAEKSKLEIQRDKEYARLEQEREVEIRKAAQHAEISRERSAKEREAGEAEIDEKRKVEVAQIEAERAVEEGRIVKERAVREADIQRRRTLEAAEIEREKTIELTNQDRAIAVAEKSKAQSEAQAEADQARAEAVRAEETVVTVRETAKADREKQVQLVEARKIAERQAIEVTVAAQARKEAAADDADAVKVKATAEAEAEKIAALAAQARYEVEAAGRLALNQADNALSEAIIRMREKLAIIDNLHEIVQESVKPLENIDGIKIIQVDGLTGASRGGAGGGDGPGNGAGLSDQVVASALRYRAQAPLVDALMKEIGMDGSSLAGLAAALSSDAPPSGETPGGGGPGDGKTGGPEGGDTPKGPASGGNGTGGSKPSTPEMSTKASPAAAPMPPAAQSAESLPPAEPAPAPKTFQSYDVKWE
ncbi:MAG: flotillin family protein [Magnetospiraceae bacterium]